jgi:hypothetical protein
MLINVNILKASNIGSVIALGIKKQNFMKKTKVKVIPAVDESHPRIKVQLDYKTIIIVRSMEAFKTWLGKFPNAKIIAS